jgi:hypothetical protein
LASGRHLVNRSDNFSPARTLTMQTDGNLVARCGSTVVWSSHTSSPGAQLQMQRDGNAVVYATSGRAVWSSGTARQRGQWLEVGGITDLGIYRLDSAGAADDPFWSPKVVPTACF